MPPRFKLRTKIQKKLIKQKITKKLTKHKNLSKKTHVQLFERAQNVTCMRKREKREPERTNAGPERIRMKAVRPN